MVKFSVFFVFSVNLYLSKVLECYSLSRYQCPTIQLDNGRVKLRSSGRVARITCFSPFMLVRGSEIATCVRGKWDTDSPICAREGCLIRDVVPHGRLEVLNQGAKLEVICETGYTIDGPSYVYCNENLKWNEELRGCKEHDQIYLSCDFESSDERFCGWKNDIYNDVDWFADRMTFIIFSSRRHVTPGSSQYFKSNYVSLDAGDYGSTSFGRLSSPPLLPGRGKRRCLIFSYKVSSGSSNGSPILKVTYGGIPHWETHEGEGRVIIGLYRFNITSKIIIEGKRCKAAIDNIIITEGDSCNPPYEEETDSCHDNCGKITNGGCSCDWECYNNNNCCPDIHIKCPYILPMDNITRLYLTTSTTVTKVTVTTTAKNTNLDVNVKNITSPSPVITTPENEHNDTITIDKVTTASTVKSSNITSTFSLVSMTKLTTKPVTVSIPLTTMSTEVPKSTLFFNSTTSRSITTNLSPNKSTVVSNIVVDSQSNSSKIINTPFMTIIPNISTSTIEPLTINKTFATEKLNITHTAITKSLMVNNTISMTTSPNTFSSTSRLDKLNPTMKVISIPTIIIKPVVENSPLTTSTFAYFSSSTVKPLIKFSTVSIVNLNNSSSITTKNVMDYSTSTTPLNNDSTKLSIKPSVPNSVEQLSNKSLKTQQTKQNTIIKEKNRTLNNSTTRIPNTVKYLNISLVPDKKMVVFDISGPNPNLKPFEYNRTLNSKDFLNITTEFYNFSDPRNTSMAFKNKNPTKVLKVHEESELNNLLQNQSMQNDDDRLAKHVKENKNAKPSYTFDTVTIIKYIAALGVVLLTFKFTLSFILLRFNKPSNDEMVERFIGIDNESYCNLELTSNHKE